jgi:hypothetical protein
MEAVAPVLLQQEKKAVPIDPYVGSDGEGPYDKSNVNFHKGHLEPSGYDWATPPPGKRPPVKSISDALFAEQEDADAKTNVLNTPLRLFGSKRSIADRGIREATSDSITNLAAMMTVKPRPRTVDMVKNEILRGTFFDDSPKTDDKCCMKIGEYGEAVHIVAKMHRGNHKGCVIALSENHLTCPVRIGWRRSKRDARRYNNVGSRLPIKHVAHNDFCPGALAKNLLSSLHPVQLAPIIYRALRENPKLSGQQATLLLLPYLASVSSITVVQDTVRQARDDMYGTKPLLLSCFLLFPNPLLLPSFLSGRIALHFMRAMMRPSMIVTTTKSRCQLNCFLISAMPLHKFFSLWNR